jgi:hypothetical protein
MEFLPCRQFSRAHLKYRNDSDQALRIDLPLENPAMFRRVLQYLYGQKLPVGTSDEPQHVEQLCEIYILAYKLELDVLQDLVVDSPYENDD